MLAGRHMWRAVTDAISVLVGGNAGEVAFTLIGTALAGTAPLNSRQLLLVNLMTDMAPAMALAVRDRPFTQPGNPSNQPGTVGRELLVRAVAVRGVTTAAGATAAWLVGRLTGTPRRASTIGLLALVATQLAQTLTMAGADRSVMLTAFGSAALLAAVVQTPMISRLFGCRPVGPLGWTTALTCATGATLAVWAYERWRGTHRVTPRADTPSRTVRPGATRTPPAQRGAGSPDSTAPGNSAPEGDHAEPRGGPADQPPAADTVGSVPLFPPQPITGLAG
jgi:cation-transporting ATPase I